jgi:hypothetical protein
LEEHSRKAFFGSLQQGHVQGKVRSKRLEGWLVEEVWKHLFLGKRAVFDQSTDQPSGRASFVENMGIAEVNPHSIAYLAVMVRILVFLHCSWLMIL